MTEVKTQTVTTDGVERHETIETTPAPISTTQTLEKGEPHGDEEAGGTLGGAVAGGAVGAVVGGPVGAVVGGDCGDVAVVWGFVVVGGVIGLGIVAVDLGCSDCDVSGEHGDFAVDERSSDGGSELG